MNLTKQQRWSSKKYRDAARGQQCTMRLPDVCNGNSETTVLAHSNGAGIGRKNDDFDAADMCSACHDVYDGRVKSQASRASLYVHFQSARYETITSRIKRGILK